MMSIFIKISDAIPGHLPLVTSEIIEREYILYFIAIRLATCNIVKYKNS